MRFSHDFGRLQVVSRVALVALIGGLASACSSDSTRMASNPFSNPFGSEAEPPATGSLPDSDAPSAPMARQSIQSAPLGAPQSYPQTSRPAQPPRPTASAGLAPTQTGAGGWSNQGASTVMVNQGETLASLSNLYGVPPQAILKANGMTSGAQVTAGRRVVIPVYNANGGDHGSAAMTQPGPARQAQAAAPAGNTHYRLVEGPKPAASQKAEKIAAQQAKSRPMQTASAEKPALQAKPTRVEATKPAKEAAKPAPEKVAAIAPAAQKPAPQPEPAKPAAKEPDATGALQTAEFRWPARGRVISGFGGAGANEGINISVPDGTPVKAAESGTVAYAGSEVKGYGNLVLIRHDNGYVSAYAHNGELNVKRGEKVKRGQVVAKSGQSGNVTSPQLHFEIRKGSTPVDPTPYLSSGT